MIQANGYKLDVLVPTHNNLHLTMACLGALYENTSVPFHIIIVDDSTDLTPLYFADILKERDNITYIHSDEPYKSGNQFFNIGIANARTPYIATVMNSVRVEPDWETAALQLLDEDPEAGIVGLKCLLPSGLIESAGIKMWEWLPTDIGSHYPAHRLSCIYECDSVQWALAITRKKAIEGNLEEDIFYGFRGWDDIDNSFVLKSKGWKVFYCGLGAGYHQPRASRGDDGTQAAIENRANGEAFYKRWGFWDKFVKAGEEIPQLTPEGWIHRPPDYGAGWMLPEAAE